MTRTRHAIAAALLALAVAGGPLVAAPTSAAASPVLTAPAKAAALPKTVGYRIATAELHLWKASTGKAYARIIKKGSTVRHTGVREHGRLQIVLNKKVYWVTFKYTKKAQWVSRVKVGESVKGRTIYAYQVGDSDASKVAVVIGQFHGEEKAGVDTARALMADARTVEGISLWVIPTVNPDGYAAGTRANARGVDLNRNWGYKWVKTAKGRYYSGPKAFSEPESKALKAFLADVDPRYVVGIHQPLYGVDSDGVKNTALQKRLIKYLKLPSKAFTCRTGCRGTMTQWVNHTLDGAAITVEYGSSPSKRYVTVTARDGLVKALGGHY